MRKITVFGVTLVVLNSNVYVPLGLSYVHFSTRARNFINPGLSRVGFFVIRIRENLRDFPLRFKDNLDVVFFKDSTDIFEVYG